MQTEYTALVDALQETNIPFAEYGWETRPNGTYGVITPEGDAGSIEGDGRKLDRSQDVSIDVFFSKKADRDAVIRTVETVLRSVCGSCWELNSSNYETQTRLFHYEWICEVIDNPTGEPAEDQPEEGEPDGVPDAG